MMTVNRLCICSALAAVVAASPRGGAARWAAGGPAASAAGHGEERGDAARGVARLSGSGPQGRARRARRRRRSQRLDDQRPAAARDLPLGQAGDARQHGVDLSSRSPSQNGLKVTQSPTLIQITGPTPEPTQRPLTPQQTLAQEIMRRRSSSNSQMRLFTYRLKHASAVQLAPVLTNLFAGYTGGQNGQTHDHDSQRQRRLHDDQHAGPARWCRRRTSRTFSRRSAGAARRARHRHAEQRGGEHACIQQLAGALSSQAARHSHHRRRVDQLAARPRHRFGLGAGAAGDSQASTCGRCRC